MSDAIGSEPVVPSAEPTTSSSRASAEAEGASAERDPRGAQPDDAAANQDAGNAQGEPKSERLTDALADLLQMAVNYLRQEAAGLMRDKVVLPGQKLGAMVAFALAASFLFALGVAFLAVALLLLLAKYLTWPGALGAIGGVLVVGAAIFTSLKVRSTQR
jgi:hypothetical protein